MADNKGEPNGENKPEDKDGSNSNPPDGGGNSSGNPPEKKDDKESLREMVRDEIKEALKSLKPDGDGTPQPRRNDIEAAAERMVREASERIRTQEEHDKDHERLRNGEAPKDEGKPITEDAPKKVRKLTKILWGEGD